MQNSVRQAVDDLLRYLVSPTAPRHRGTNSHLLPPLPDCSPTDFLPCAITSSPTPKSRLMHSPRVFSRFSRTSSIRLSHPPSHASRYFELYHPSGSIEIAHTSRYSHKTGKSELCILATRYMAPGTVITELKGSMANLTDEEDRDLKRAGMRNGDIRRDFSVIHSKSMKKNHLFLGPARFVNVCTVICLFSFA